MKLIVPSLARDLDVLINNKDRFFDYLPIDRIVVIGSGEVEKRVEGQSGIEFIDEQTVCDYQMVYEAVTKRSFAAKNRVGWYYQQFLKMAYAKLSADEYYLLWDSDTVPVRKHVLFNGERPYFDLKREYHKAYFKTIKLLFPEIEKALRASFISEHMMIRTEYMKEMIDLISESKIEGKSWIEKIVNSIPEKELPNSGFSEYETYGSYVTKKHHDEYLIRRWHSLRFGELFFEKGSRIADKDVEWLGKHYDAISFEKHEGKSVFAAWVSNWRFQKLVNPIMLETLSFVIRAKRKIRKIWI